LTTQEKAGLQLPFLSDSGNKVAQSFGIHSLFSVGLERVGSPNTGTTTSAKGIQAPYMNT
jgi:peroxiredoxin